MFNRLLMRKVLFGEKLHIAIVACLAIFVLLISAQYLWTGNLHSSALGQSLNDQTGYITTARNIAENGKYESSIYYPGRMPYYKTHNIPYMPLNYYVRAGFYYLFGYSLFTSFLPNLLAYIGSAILLFMIAERFFDRKTAYIGTILFMLFPPAILYAFTAMQELIFVFFCLLSFFVFTIIPQKNRYILGGFVLLIPFLIRETAAFMVFGFAGMIYFESTNRRFLKIVTFSATSLLILISVNLLPAVSDRPPLVSAALPNFNETVYFNAFVSDKISFNFAEKILFLLSHFLENIKSFGNLLMLRPWGMELTFFVIELSSFVFCAGSMLLNFTKNKMFSIFVVITSGAVCLALFIMLVYHGYIGIRMVLFMVPFSFCIIAQTLFASKILNNKTFFAVIAALILIVNIYFTNDSLQQIRDDFARADTYDQECANFLDSIGVFNMNFIIAPHEISLDYVNRHYPIKWSFVPDNEKTLRLIDSKYSVDLLIIPINHKLMYESQSNQINSALFNGEFILAGKRLFLGKLYLIFVKNKIR